MNNIYYLDHASTSYPVRYFAKDYYIPANPNSPHALGLQANQALNEARQRIMDCLGVRSGKVLFCRCATEAVEWLCKTINKHRILKNNIVCSLYEHDSVVDSCYDVWDTKYLNVLMDRKNLLYLHQYVNQLTGTVFPIESIGKQVQSTGAFFGSDITASLGHYPLPENLDAFCDAVWFSGRKIQCETMGAIWLSDRLFKYLGGDESHMITGTPNVPGAIALSYAVEHAVENATSNWVEHRTLANKMLFDLQDEGIEARIVCDESLPKAHSINALYLPGFNGDALVNFLSSKNIYISPGHSACADNDDYRVLESFNLTKDQASQTIRVSFGEDTSTTDIDALVDGIVEFKNLFI